MYMSQVVQTGVGKEVCDSSRSVCRLLRIMCPHIKWLAMLADVPCLPLPPHTVKSLGDMMAALGLGEFTRYASRAGLDDIMEARRPGVFTIFAARDEAFTGKDRHIAQLASQSLVSL